jgi:hypothetical protein
MTTKARTRLLFCILFVGLGGFAVWSYLQMQSASGMLSASQQNYAVCRRAADEIAKLRGSGALEVSGSSQSTGQIVHAIEESMGTAGLSSDKIGRIDPQPPRKVAESSYQEQITQIEVRQASLPQLITMLHKLSIGTARLNVKQLRVSAPAREQPAANSIETWTADVSLSAISYAPQTMGKARGEPRGVQR